MNAETDSGSRPTYLVGSPSPFRDRIAGELTLDDGVVFDTPDRVVGEADPGVVLLLVESVEATDAVELLYRLAAGRGEWTPCLVRRTDGEVEVRTISLGWRESLEDVEAFLEGDQDRLLELRRTITRIGRARHDINNPLTSGLAETQLLLMDVTESELVESLEIIQTQLRRIRDMVAATQGLRSGRDSEKG